MHTREPLYPLSCVLNTLPLKFCLITFIYCVCECAPDMGHVWHVEPVVGSLSTMGMGLGLHAVQQGLTD